MNKPVLIDWVKLYGEPISPDDLSDTRLSTNNFVPPYTVIATLFCALVTDDANLNLCRRYSNCKVNCISSIFSGKSPLSLKHELFHLFVIV